jgi:hypothetical protein
VVSRPFRKEHGKKAPALLTHQRVGHPPGYVAKGPDRASDFLQTALSDLLRTVSLHHLCLIARSSSDRVLTYYGYLPGALIDFNSSMGASVCYRQRRSLFFSFASPIKESNLPPLDGM